MHVASSNTQVLYHLTYTFLHTWDQEGITFLELPSFFILSANCRLVPISIHKFLGSGGGGSGDDGGGGRSDDGGSGDGSCGGSCGK